MRTPFVKTRKNIRASAAASNFQPHLLLHPLRMEADATHICPVHHTTSVEINEGGQRFREVMPLANPQERQLMLAGPLQLSST